MRIAIVGSGSISSRYQRIITSEFTNDLTIISDFQPKTKKNPTLSRSEAKSLNIPKQYFDLLIIASENSKHLFDYFDFNLVAKKILFEKPLHYKALDLNEIDLLSKRELDIFISSPLRFHEGFYSLKNILNQVGEISNIESRCQSWLPDWRPWRDHRDGFWNKKNQGGVLREIVHELDYLIKLFEDISCTYAVAANSNFLNLEVESSIDALLLTKMSRLINLHLDYSSKVSRRFLRIDGTNSSVEWDVLKGTVTKLTNNGAYEIDFYPMDLDRDTIFKRQLQYILQTKPWPVAPTSLSEAIQAINLIDEIYLLCQ